jgi:hypothetical protein
LCYVAIGQIVNRQLNAVRYQPSACLVINSPVETPSLAEAVRKDWSGLTPEAHRLSLTQDALDPWPYAAPAALKRLCFYYAQAGDTLARKLLARRLYAPNSVRDFVIKRLVKERDPLKWDALIEEYKKEEGPAAVDALPLWIHSINWAGFLETEKEVLAAKDMATQILAKRFSYYNPLEPPFIDAMEPKQAADLVRGLCCIRTAVIDKAVHELFHKATAFKAKREEDRILCDELVMACMSRLSGKGLDDEFRAFCKKRIKEIESMPVTLEQQRELLDYRDRLKKLGG